MAVEKSAPTSAAASPPPGMKYTPAARTRMIAMFRIAVVLTPTAYGSRRTAAEHTAAARRRRRRRRTSAQHVLGRRRKRRGRLGGRDGRRPVRALGREAIPHTEVRVDVAPGRRRGLELVAHLAHEHVHRAVAARHGVAPHALVDLLALEDASLGAREQLDQLELAPREVDRAVAHVGLEAVGADLD